MSKNEYSFVVLVFLLACTPKTSTIQYGKDKCANCVMTIVDPRFGCEIVTIKGKVFKFDAVECMVQYIESRQLQKDDLAAVVTNTYDDPAALKNVYDCVFLKSQNLPSPMGRNLNPISNFEEAARMQQLHGGEIYQWEPLKVLLSR